jgi:phosphate transport system protein
MPLHTSHEYAAELRALKDRILTMGGRCESIMLRAMLAVEQHDADLALLVESTDAEINADEVAVDEMAVRILALRQPVGRDLRFLVSALKVVVDLERIGDEAVNIAERARELAESTRMPPTAKLLPHASELALAMLRDALDAFVDGNVEKARDVLVRDDAVDECYGEIVRKSMAYMAEHPEDIKASMSVASCAKYIERIADHSTNIAEMVVYMVRGEDVRHRFSLEK